MDITKIIDNSEWPLNSLLVSQKHRVIYTPIAKNANTTLKRLFVRLSGYARSDEILGGDVHTYLTSNQTGLSLCDYSPGDATEILSDPSYFRYVVLRDPLARAVSGYLDKFVLYPPPSGTHGEPPTVIGTGHQAHTGNRPQSLELLLIGFMSAGVRGRTTTAP